MIPVPVFWTQYTATVQGRRLKNVACENCSTEYVYVIEREAVSASTSMYGLNNTGVAAATAAGETLSAVLENDFDPVPCPACGHYQRYMFPKVLGNTGLWARVGMLVAVFIGCLVAVSAVLRSVTYLQQKSDDTFRRMATAWSAVLILCLTAFGLSLVNKIKIRRFNPNVGDPQARIAIGRIRAVTRAEFEKAQNHRS
jgi:hypothetical protein